MRHCLRLLHFCPFPSGSLGVRSSAVNAIEFNGIKTRIVDLLPEAEKYDDVRAGGLQLEAVQIGKELAVVFLYCENSYLNDLPTYVPPAGIE